MMDVGIVIVTHNSGEEIGACLDALLVGLSDQLGVRVEGPHGRIDLSDEDFHLC